MIIPFIAGTKEDLKKMISNLQNQIPTLLLSILFICIIFSVQLIYYKIATGNFIVYSYGDEKFNFLNPHLFDFLFSYKKGLFVYLPLTLLSLTGFVFLYQKNKWQFYSLLSFLILLIFILSCWWNWWFGGSFGTRPMVEFLFVFSILLGYALNNLHKNLKKIFITICLFFVILCLVQTYQYRYYFIHWENMNKERYWKVFMRVDLIANDENPNDDLLK